MANGLLPLLGLLWWGWSGVAAVVFYLVHTWLEMFSDFAKYRCLEEYFDAHADAYRDDAHVWHACKELRSGRNLPSPSQPVRFDIATFYQIFACSLVGTVLIVMLLKGVYEEAHIPLRDFFPPSMWLSLCVMVVARIATTYWEIQRHQDEANRLNDIGSDQVIYQPKLYAIGERALGLYVSALLMVLMVFFTNPPNGPWKSSAGFRWTMLVVNGSIAIAGLASLVRIKRDRREAVWLRRYLGWEQQQDESA